MLVHGAALDSHGVGPQRRHRLFEARRAVDDDQLRRSQSAPDEIVEQRTPGRLAFPPMLLIASSIFWPSARTPSATSNEIEVAPSVEPDTRDQPRRRGSAARSALRRANAHSRRPSRPSSCARRG